MVGARILERRSQPAEGFPGAELDRHRDVDRKALPAVAARDPEESADGARLDRLDPNVVGLLDDCVVLRWRVVVGVAGVAAGHDPADSHEAAELERAIVGHVDGEQAVVELALPNTYWVFDFSSPV